MLNYRAALIQAMTELGRREDAIFLGQAVAYPGTGMTSTFSGVPADKLLELPVFENTQMGMSIGLAMAGYLPITIYPRHNFLICAMDQLVNHLDKLPEMGAGNPKVIIRTAVPWPRPMDPGPQHKDDLTLVFKMALRNVNIVDLDIDGEQVLEEYHAAAQRDGSTILIEHARLY